MSVKQVVMAAAGALGGGDKLYVEDVFSTYLYTGNGSTQTITNGIDLAGEGGLVWNKHRSTADAHGLWDTARGVNAGYLQSEDTGAQSGSASQLTSFNANGFTLPSSGYWNTSGTTYASWTFRKAPKFFDVVTWTGNGSTQTISHALDAAPAVVIIKKTSATSNWYYMHSMGVSNCGQIFLDLTNASSTSSYNSGNVFSAKPTSTSLFLGSEGDTNASGSTFVAYLFAHDAGGFGDDGTENIISCGSYTEATGANAVNLGWEPQWLLVKKSNSTGNWWLVDTMRGATADGTDALLWANGADAEISAGGNWEITSTGFANYAASGSGDTYIYIAIRRGPMKTPESGTEVFALDVGYGSSVPAFTSNFPVDAALYRRPAETDNMDIGARLTGAVKLKTNLADAETADGDWKWDYQNGWYGVAQTSELQSWMFRRGPSFMDVVTYDGNGSTQSVSHNLTVAPELILVKWRSGGATSYDWRVYHADLGITNWGRFTSSAFSTASSPYPWDTPTSSVFKLGDGSYWLSSNGSGRKFIAYLFASCPGVSKVSSYTGTGADINIDCGFSSGARFVLIKRTDSTGDWYVWDSVRGIVSGNDPYLLLNTTDAENTSTDYIDPLASGFTVTSSAPAALNASGGNYIFLAIA